MCVGTGTAIGFAITAGATATGAIVASRNAAHGADVQAASTDKAAAIQSKSAADELAFKRQQAETDWRNSQQTAKANYDQWAAGRGRLRSLASMTGVDLGADPAFQPGIDPRFDSAGGAPLPSTTTASPTTAGAPGSAPGAVNWTAPPDQLAAQLSAYFKSKGVADTEVPYWVREAGSLVARGQQLNDPAYADKRLAAADILGGGRSAPAAATAPPVSMATLAYGGTPTTATPILAPGVTGMPTQPYAARRPYSFADLVR